MWNIKSLLINIDNGLSRDFQHLSQAIHKIGKDGNLKHELAVILEKCIKDEDYKNSAIGNLASLARDYEQVKTDLQYFVSSKDPDYAEIRPVAEAVIKEIDSCPKNNLWGKYAPLCPFMKQVTVY